jgi:hypothetical protein
MLSQALQVVKPALLSCRIRFTDDQGKLITEFSIKDCAPPAYRPEHELRVVMREAIPRHLSAQLPPGTVHYNSNVVDVTADAQGSTSLHVS